VSLSGAGSGIVKRWARWIVNHVLPAFGGIPTFCEDPDGLLEVPEVREALRQNGMTLHDWDGSPDVLAAWKAVAEDAIPLIVVGPDAKRHVAEATLPDLIWEHVSVGEMMPRFYVEVVKAVPSELWDRLLALHDQERYKRPPQESATLIGRALYGIDPEYLKHSDAGWLALLARIAAEPEGVPLPIARAVVETAPPPTFLTVIDPVSLLTEPTTAKSALITSLATETEWKEALGKGDQIVVAHLVAEAPASYQAAPQADLLALWDEHAGTMDGVLRFGLLYGAAVAHGAAEEKARREVNHRFAQWLEAQYGLMLSSHNPDVLRLHTLLDRLDEQVNTDRLLLLVVDAMGVISWQHVYERWKQDGIIARAKTRSAFAVLPTITSLSRRALFEGKLPASFSDDKHSQRLERTLWLPASAHKKGRTSAPTRRAVSPMRSPWVGVEFVLSTPPGTREATPSTREPKRWGKRRVPGRAEPRCAALSRRHSRRATVWCSPPITARWSASGADG
jgi:hypothetical protein